MVRTKEEVIEEFRCSSIQDAALAVIARKGVADTTMQEIASEAGVAKATLYVYFKDRDELLTKTAARAYDGLVAELEVAFHAPGNLPEKLKGIVLRQLAFFDENRELFRASMSISPHPARKPRTGSYGRYLDLLEGLFAEAKERGELRDGVDPREIAAIYSDFVRGIVIRRIESKSKTPRDEQANAVVSMLLGGIQEKYR